MAAEPSPWETPERPPSVCQMPMGCRGSSPSKLGSKEGYGSLTRQAGRPLCSCSSQDTLQPRRTDCRPPKHLRAFAQAVLAAGAPCLPSLSTLFLSIRSLLRHHLLQEASLMPQPELSSSSGSPPGLCLCHYDSDHPML